MAMVSGPGMGRHVAGLVVGGVLRGTGAVSYGVSRAREPGTLTNVYFHQPTAAAFRACVTWLLRSGYRPVSCRQIDEAIHEGRPLPRQSVHISLDDAWRSNLTEVVPVAQELDVPVTIFVPTDAVESGHYWWTRVERTRGGGEATIERLKTLPDDERRRKVLSLTGLPDTAPREAMTLAELRRISALAQVTIGSHTVSHPILPRCSDAVLDHEVGRSREILEGWLDRTVDTFSYPNGDLDDRVVEAVRRHGYRLAFTTRQTHGRIDGADPLRLPRFALLNEGPAAENICRATGAWSVVFRH